MADPLPTQYRTPANPEIDIEVAYARPDRQWLIALRVPSGCSAIAAVHASGLVESAALSEPLSLGIFGRACQSDAPLNHGDRVEIYRELSYDPMESRRRRAAHRAQRPKA